MSSDVDVMFIDGSNLSLVVGVGRGELQGRGMEGRWEEFGCLGRGGDVERVTEGGMMGWEVGMGGWWLRWEWE